MTKLYYWFLRRFGIYPTVSGAISGVLKTIQKLEVVAEHHFQSSQLKRTVAKKLISDADAHNAEAAHAVSVAQNIKAIVS